MNLRKVRYPATKKSKLNARSLMNKSHRSVLTDIAHLFIRTLISYHGAQSIGNWMDKLKNK